MTTKTKSLRISSDLNNAINDYLKVTGESFNSFAESAMADKMENLLDLKDYKEAIKSDDGTRFTIDEVARELNIDL